MHALSAITAIFLAIAAPALAAVSPTSPSAGTVVRIGQDLTALWTADSTGQWTDMTVQLMTGDNFQVSAGGCGRGEGGLLVNWDVVGSGRSKG